MVYRFSQFTLDAKRLVLTERGRVVPLARKVVETLSILVAEAGSSVSKERLINELWPDGFVEDGNLSQNIYVLRRTFRERGIEGAIETLPRRGYRFVLPLCTGPRRSFGLSRILLAAACLAALVVGLRGATADNRAALNGESARLYALGRYYWNLRSMSGMERSIGYFRAVVAHAPNSALGYAGLADAYTELVDMAGPCGQCALWSRAAVAAAHRAVAVDPQSSAAHVSLGMTTRLFGHDDAAAATEFRRAIALDDGNSLAHEWYGNLLVAHGALNAGRRELELAASMQPVATATYAWLARDYYYLRRYGEAERYAKEALALEPTRVETTTILGLAYEAERRERDAMNAFSRLERIGDARDAQVLIAGVYADEGDTARSLAILHRSAALFGRDPYVSGDLVLGYSKAGETKTALRYLSRLHFASLIARELFVLDPRVAALRNG